MKEEERAHAFDVSDDIGRSRDVALEGGEGFDGPFGVDEIRLDAFEAALNAGGKIVLGVDGRKGTGRNASERVNGSVEHLLSVFNAVEQMSRRYGWCADRVGLKNDGRPSPLEAVRQEKNVL